uniref:Putative secreted protein n=1 Tax=Anopheles marajoara TaxID=58244 RepID=A0A2M4CDG0_9DIPT
MGTIPVAVVVVLVVRYGRCQRQLKHDDVPVPVVLVAVAQLHRTAVSAQPLTNSHNVNSISSSSSQGRCITPID